MVVMCVEIEVEVEEVEEVEVGVEGSRNRLPHTGWA